jgi:redox-sensitive bicupin YhaK (pirin superfamily)
MQQGPWLPLERFAESVASGEPVSDPHAHEKEEVVNYVLDGSATYLDGTGTKHEMRPGMVAVLSSLEPSRHDLIPGKGVARWLSLVVRLSQPRSAEWTPLQIAPAVLRRPTSSRLRWLSVLGGDAPASSSVGVELAHLTFLATDRMVLEVPSGVRVVAYVLEGTPQIGGWPVVRGSGLLAQGSESFQIDGKDRDQVAFVLAPSGQG